MRGRDLALRLLATGAVLVSAHPAAAQTVYVPGRTEWGDPDFRGTWPTDRIADAGIPLQRPEAMGERRWMTDEEFAQRVEEATNTDASFAQDVDANGTAGLAAWLQATPFGRRTSLIVDPPNGRLPPMTEGGQALFAAGRSSWVDNQPIDWVTDLDSYDRCITRGLPAAILPWPNNNGVRIFQSPGFVVLQLEVLGTRIVPVGHGERWPQAARSWMGQSLGHWEGDMLVIETGAIVAGDSASSDVSRRAGSPITGRAYGLVPMSEKATTIERLTMTGPDTITYEVTYSDPDVYSAPWTAEFDWTRNDGYQLYEFACHEGNEVRHMITGSRAERGLGMAMSRGTGNAQQDGTGKWPFPASDVPGTEQVP